MKKKTILLCAVVVLVLILLLVMLLRHRAADVPAASPTPVVTVSPTSSPSPSVTPAPSASPTPTPTPGPEITPSGSGLKMREFEISAVDGAPASGAVPNTMPNASGAGSSGVTINTDGHIVLPGI